MFDKQTKRFIACVVDALPVVESEFEDKMQYWISRPEALRKALEDVFCPEPTLNKNASVSNMVSRTWFKLQLGCGPAALGKALKDACVDSTPNGDYLVSKVVLSATPREVELIKVSVAQLGFENGGMCEEIFARADQLGLSLCPAEVGPLLSLQNSQKMRKMKRPLRIAMEAIADSRGDPCMFDIFSSDEGTVCLGGWPTPSKLVLGGGLRLVFVRKTVLI